MFRWSKQSRMWDRQDNVDVKSCPDVTEIYSKEWSIETYVPALRSDFVASGRALIDSFGYGLKRVVFDFHAKIHEICNRLWNNGYNLPFS